MREEQEAEERGDDRDVRPEAELEHHVRVRRAHDRGDEDAGDRSPAASSSRVAGGFGITPARLLDEVDSDTAGGITRRRSDTCVAMTIRLQLGTATDEARRHHRARVRRARSRRTCQLVVRRPDAVAAPRRDLRRERPGCSSATSARRTARGSTACTSATSRMPLAPGSQVWLGHDPARRAAGRSTAARP